ncbi:hypothetical protein LTR62_000497 [Meristemomyces frigidus]|uniref:SprT-like domain-containing protein n=1 Tax=Meristemomyces frigidus TaxID=1508187 RepID=A0AAN7TA40_9PEZI|nr:hypothetical protein LTR62_000497 [Meristemomyces frigidus]
MPPEQDLFARANKGTIYDIDPTELRILQDPNFGPAHSNWRPHPAPIHPREALAKFFESPEADQKSREAEERLQRALSQPDARFDLLIKIFNDLDTVIFQNQLRRRVLLQWSQHDLVPSDPRNRGNPDGFVLAQTHEPGWAGQARIAIIMNLQAPWQELRRQRMVGSLVHEMVHAWYKVHCVPFTDTVTEPHRRMGIGHGYYFWMIGRWIERKFGLRL